MKLGLFFAIIIFSKFSSASSIVAINSEKKLPDISSYNDLIQTNYSLFFHKRNFLMPFSYNWNPHDDIYNTVPGYSDNGGSPFYDNKEAEIQISFFIPLYKNIAKSDWDLLFAYTHHSWWQLYNSAWSKPFRETNYTPELFFRRMDDKPYEMAGFSLIAYDLGYIHQSNGEIQILSRSWDRLFARLYFSQETFFINFTGWMRLPEDPKTDDNPTISDYKGFAELQMYKTFGLHSIEFTMPISKNFGLDLEYSYPWYGHLRWFVSARTGYGQSLIEFNRDTKRIGFGITLENFMDKN